MTFTRQHYKAIAEIIAHSETKQQIIEKLVRYFKADNERFDAYRFREYINQLEHANDKTITSFSIARA